MSIITCRSHSTRAIPPNTSGPVSKSLLHYVGAASGPWRVTEMTTLSGAPLKPATHVQIAHGQVNPLRVRSSWVLKGVVRNTRFFSREERLPLNAHRFAPNPSETTCAALIPIRKSAEWWKLDDEDRQQIVEARSRAITRGFGFIPAIARRLLYGRDLGEPFDLVTWFEYSPSDARIFDDLTCALRASEEWKFVEREIDIRLVRD